MIQTGQKIVNHDLTQQSEANSRVCSLMLVSFADVLLLRSEVCGDAIVCFIRGISQTRRSFIPSRMAGDLKHQGLGCQGCDSSPSP